MSDYRIYPRRRVQRWAELPHNWVKLWLSCGHIVNRPRRKERRIQPPRMAYCRQCKPILKNVGTRPQAKKRRIE